MAYGGHPTIPGLTAITPALTLSRASGSVPFVVQVHGADTTATFSDGGAAFEAAVGRAFDPYCDLEFSWSFGDAAGAETLTHPVYGGTVNANADQRGPEAAYVYRTPGTYTITLTVRGWNGSGYVTASTTTTVTVSAWAGADRYFDSNYDGSNGASDGTIDRPYAAFADLKGWAEGADNRRALVKRGSTFDASTRLDFGGTSTIRVEAYGTGAAPVLSADSGSGPVQGLSIHGTGASEDVVLSGLELRAGPAAAGSIWFRTAGEYGDPADPYKPLRDYAFLDCAFAGPAAAQLGYDHASGRWTFWRCDFHRDATTYQAGQGLLIALGSGLAVVGGSFAGGDGDIIRDHHIYPSIGDHSLYRWIDFRAATSLNFCINTNARSDGIDTPHVLVDGGDLTGTTNGLDASNGYNDPALGQFDQFLIQDSAIHVGQIGNQGVGWFTTGLRRAVVRDCAFWGNPDNDIGAGGDPEAHVSAYRNRFDKPDAAAVGLGVPQAGYLAANTFGVTGYPPAPDADPQPTTRRRFPGRRHV